MGFDQLGDGHAQTNCKPSWEHLHHKFYAFLLESFMYDHDRVAVDCSGRSSNSFLELDPSRKYRRAESTMFIMARTSNALALRHGEEHGINMYTQFVMKICVPKLVHQTGL